METTFKTLTKIIKDSDNILIMAHKNIDLDAFGSSLALYSIIKSFNKNVGICINKMELNTSVKKAFDLVSDNDINYIYKTKISDFKPELLIILDTSKLELLEDSKIVEKVKKTVIIDHHIVTNKNIENAAMSYINSNLSSTNEFMSGYLKYLNKEVTPNFASIMLAGIEVDTNYYRVKTSRETFLAAAHLSLLGADSLVRQELLKEDRAKYLKRMKYIENTKIINGIAVCVIDDDSFKEELSMISEKLISFDKIKASFTIGKTCDKMVSISARSLGNFDVYKIMKNLGGGGHLNEAAAQFKDTDVLSVKKQLIKEMEDYL